MSHQLSSTLTRTDYEYIVSKVNVTYDVVVTRIQQLKNIEQFTVDQLKSIIKYLRSLPQFHNYLHQLRVTGNKPDLVQSLHTVLQAKPLTGSSTNNTVANHHISHSLSNTHTDMNYRTAQVHQQPQSYQYNTPYNTPYNLQQPTTTTQQYQQPYRPTATGYAQPVQPQYRPNGTYNLPQQSYNQYNQHNTIQQPAQSIDTKTVLASDEFKLHNRSPYEHVDSIMCSNTLIHGHTTHMQFSFAPLLYQKLKRTGVTLSKAIPASQMTDIQLRLFDTVKKQHIPWDRSFRVKINNTEIPMPEPRKLNKLKAKGLQIVKPLLINDYCGMYNNNITIDYFRSNYQQAPFIGIVVCEIVTEKDTADLLNMIKNKAQLQSNGVIDTHNSTNNIQQIKQASPLQQQQPTIKQCAVCHKPNSPTTELQRCSQCKSVWYCGRECQSADWNNHKAQCKPLALQLQQQSQQTTTNNTITSQPTDTTHNNTTVKAEPGHSVRPKFDLTHKPPKRTGSIDDDVQIADDEDGVQETETLLSLRCPLSIDRIQCAAKGKYCDHLTCFDLETYLLYCQQSSIWQCALCSEPLPFDEIVIDPVFNAILKCTHEETEKIKVLPNGDWVEINSLLNEPTNNIKKRKIENSVPNGTNGTAKPQTSSIDVVPDDSNHITTNSDSESYVPVQPSYTLQSQQSVQQPYKPVPTIDKDNHFDRGGSVEDAIEID